MYMENAFTTYFGPTDHLQAMYILKLLRRVTGLWVASI